MTNHRPIHQRLAEQEAKLAKLRAKALKEAVNEDVSIVAIDKNIASLNRELLTINRHIEQGAEKHENFLARAMEWKNRVDEASERKPNLIEELHQLRSHRANTAETLAGEMSIQKV